MLHIHRAERADRLVDALGAVLAEPLDDPFTPDVVAVPTRGVERWLTQRLAATLGATAGRGDGVCANVVFPFPERVVAGAVAAAAGVDRATDPWAPERSVWPLLDVVDESTGDPWMAPLTAALEGSRLGGRFSRVRHVAELFARYDVHRPAMVLAWAGGADVDGSGRTLPVPMVWQPELWRRLRHRIGQPGPAERLEAATAALTSDPALVDLPPRLSVFGLTRLPASFRQVLEALGAHRDVHMFLLHPSPVLWDRVNVVLAAGRPGLRRADDPTAELAASPLLASWGRDGRELQVVMATDAGPATGHHHRVDASVTSLLHRLQADIRADRPPSGAPLPGQADQRPVLDPSDRSLQVHGCHGRARQVEVLRHAILHLLDDDPTLEPRDVIVMCPDIEAFAPLIHASFGAHDVDDDPDSPRESPGPAGRPPDLRVRLADRSLRQTNPLLGVVAELMELAAGRLTAAQVLDLAGREPVRRRFRFDDEELAQLQEWVVATGIRWGLDAAHRAPYKLEAVSANTWRAGLDRILVGVTMAGEGQRLVGGVLPLDDVDSGAIDLAGRVAELIGRLGASLGELRQPRPLGEWMKAIASAVDALAEVGERDRWQTAQLRRVLADVLDESTATGFGPELALPDVRAILGDRLRGRPTRANFRTGHLTFCTLVPMRSVPHRVVCLLGLDDGAFPRQTPRDGDDLLLADPHLGDRDPRSEDRQLLLDALLAATDRLVITYAGRDERTNVERPPAVPLGELLDVVDRTVRCAPELEVEPAPASRRQVVVNHPLQPFDLRNFTPGALVAGRRWSYDRVALDGARALARPRRPPVPFLPGPLPDRAPTTGSPPTVELDELVRFLQHPVRAFLRERLGVTLGDRHDEPADSLPVELDGLERWAVGQRLLEARLRGISLDDAIAAERAAGVLPPGALADPVVDGVVPTVEALVKEAASLEGQGPLAGADAVEVRLLLAGGEVLTGTVAGVAGEGMTTVTYSRVGPRHRLASWVRLLALTAAFPERGFSAVTIGRARSKAPRGSCVTVATIAAFDGDAGTRQAEATGHLEALIDLYRRGLRQPLPLYCATSAAYAQAEASGGDPPAAAQEAWESGWSFDGEDADLEHKFVLGGVRPFGEILAELRRDDEVGPGWPDRDSSRLGRYAIRLWEGLLAREEVVDR